MYLRNLFLLHPWPVGAILSLAVPYLLQEVVIAAEPPAGYGLVYSQDFQKSDALRDFQFSDPDAWRLGTQNGRHFMEQFQKSNYEYKVRSPYNIGLLRTLRLRNFILECELQQTGKDYGHRDMCLFYNFQNRSQFYYSHIATKPDDHAHSCFLVDNKPRIRIDGDRTNGFDWGKDAWHQFRLVRNADRGTITLFADGGDTPIMTATDKTFGWGYVGFGTFDDTGRVSNVKIWAPEMQPGEENRNLFAE